MKPLAKEKTGSRTSIFISEDKLHSFPVFDFTTAKDQDAKAASSMAMFSLLFPASTSTLRRLSENENSVIRICNRKWLSLASRQSEEVLAEVVPAHQD